MRTSQFVPLVVLSSAIITTCFADCSSDVLPITDTLFSSLGNDCETYVSLYAEGAVFYHQIEGYKSYEELQAVCDGYGGFCPEGGCSFERNGDPYTITIGDECHVLVPFLWSQFPANNQIPNNREPHSGFLHNTLIPNSSAAFDYKISVFREIEDSYSVAFNWADPSDTSVYSWVVALLDAVSNDGSCDNPINDVITTAMDGRAASADDLWRQQGSAVLLATGGICHVLVPYTAVIDATIASGRIVFELMPNTTAANNYTVSNSFVFSTDTVYVTPETTTIYTTQACESQAVAVIPDSLLLVSVLLSVIMYT